MRSLLSTRYTSVDNKEFEIILRGVNYDGMLLDLVKYISARIGYSIATVESKEFMAGYQIPTTHLFVYSLPDLEIT